MILFRPISAIYSQFFHTPASYWYRYHIDLAINQSIYLSQDVKQVKGGSNSVFSVGAVNPSAIIIATWMKTTTRTQFPLVVELHRNRVKNLTGKVVAVNMLPALGVGWLPSTQGDVLLANALKYVGNYQE